MVIHALDTTTRCDHDDRVLGISTRCLAISESRKIRIWKRVQEAGEEWNVEGLVRFGGQNVELEGTRVFRLVRLMETIRSLVIKP